MFKTKLFPSVFEASTAELIDVADDLVTGLKIKLDDTSYIVGDLALVEGNSPHKGINNSPSDLDYRLLLHAALAIAKVGTDEGIALTTGFPHSSYSAFRDAAQNLIQGRHKIQFDGRTFGGDSHSSMEVTVNDVEVIPEIEGLIHGVRKGELQESDPFFAVSLGYGTFEAVLSLPSGPVQRTATSGNGLRFATNRMTEQLQQEHYLDMLTEHQIDVAMQESSIIVGRRRIDLSDLRRKVLHMYYQDVISPALQKAFSDSDFGRARKMYIAGGGAHYDDIIKAFKDEFDEVLDVQVVPNPETFISQGFALHAEEHSSDPRQRAVGLDLGNANTVITLPEEKEAREEESAATEQQKEATEEEGPSEEEPVSAKEAPSTEDVLFEDERA